MRILGVTVAAFMVLGCIPAHRQHRLIDLYTSAHCVPLSTSSTVVPPVREWDAMLRTSQGRVVRVSGWQAVSGRIVARDETGATHVVADAGDYVYPEDVRTSREGDTVFVKARGLAGGLFDETWLFAYDLLRFKETGKIRVEPTALPPRCPGGPTGS